ncbi:YjcZ family sporulation protein [Bacillus clarus]|uniref:YjcZ family sporulation protein n=1 Tax=Bacillus clarus TaxID=2338372 RepID=A0ABX9KWE6_9BACI|nr:YjcZ family sporulation protein [Bacillus clarus]
MPTSFPKDLLIHTKTAYSNVIFKIKQCHIALFFLYKGGQNTDFEAGCGGFSSGFALLVVLFILLIIIGCSCFGGGFGC